MDSSVVLGEDGELYVVENRNLKVGDKVILGRTENAEQGIYLHSTVLKIRRITWMTSLSSARDAAGETSYARDYDRLFELLKYEREHGNIVWVMGPRFRFRRRRQKRHAGHGGTRLRGRPHGWKRSGYPRPGRLHVPQALGQDIYTQKSQTNGHYNHLDVINRVRRSGSIPKFIEDYKIDNGIIYSCVKKPDSFRPDRFHP